MRKIVLVHRQFSMSFAFELTSGQWGRSAENWTSTSANSINILSAILSHTPCGLSSLIQNHYSSEPGPINDHCPFLNFLAYRDTRLAFARHSVSLSIDLHEMLLNIYMNMIFPLIFSGVSFNLNSNS